MNNKKPIPMPLIGGCQCGGIRYEITEMPLTLYVCHCTECQRQSSSGFGMSMPVPRRGFTLTKGETQHWSRRAASGRTVNCHFCPTCGTRLFHTPSRNDTIVNVKPGTLDETRWLKPVGHLWTQSAQAWVSIPLTALLFEGQPTDHAPLYDAWKAQVEA